MIRFDAPLWFALVPAVLFLLWRFRTRSAGPRSFGFSALALIRQKRSWRMKTEPLLPILLAAGMLLLIAAQARPQRVLSTAAGERPGIDIVLVFDTSGSMAAEDFKPRNRFVVARDLFISFVETRANDRIGVVTFGARAATRVPITFDHEVVKRTLQQVRIGEHGDGTAIGQGIATGVARLRSSKSRSRVLVLLTDGVNNAGSIEPATAAVLAKKSGVKIYAIGVGSRGEVPVPVKMQSRITGQIETVYQYIRADLDEPLLTAIARESGGAYFRAVDQETLQRVLQQIDQLEKSLFARPKTVTVDELYLYPLAAGALLVILAILAGETLWIRLPA